MKEQFMELLYQNQGIVHKICNLYFMDRLEKEDYQQELIIQLWKAFPTYNNTAKFSTWMYRVCINAAIDIKRKEQKQLKYTNLSEARFYKANPNNEVNSTHKEKLYEAISRLSDVDRAIITLHLEEYSYKEISEIIGISTSHVGVKINRIKSRILKSFKDGNR